MATRDELEAAGIKSFIVGHICSTQDLKAYTFQNTLDDVRDLGAIFGIPQRAEQVVRDLQARWDNVTTRVANRQPLRVVTADPTEQAFYAPGSGTYAMVVSHAGGTNVFDGGEDGYGQISVEEVAAANAQAYVIINYLPETPEQRIARIQAAAPTSEGVRQRRYAVVQNSELWVGPRIVDGLEKVARVLHPEAFQ
jgi:iron complex transport system substrate-binding protein